MDKREFFYDLPYELIAQSPLEPRDSSKLMYYDRHRQAIFDRIFTDLPDLLNNDDLLVINNTRVLPARIYGIKRETGARIEFLLHKRLSLTDWEVLCRPAKRLKAGFVDFGEELSAEILSNIEGGGGKIVRFHFDGVFEEILSKIGEMPLPPYIRERLKDSDRYQTVYAKTEGSSAAPTAGLHFTPDLLEKLKQKGIETAEVLLHVGLGTFLPVKTDNIMRHKMHSEYFSVSKEAAEKINRARAEGRRVIAVGTTSVRVLESVSSDDGIVHEGSGETEIFIYPPYKFKAVDGVITNFHLPESTLIMLISAFAGKDETMRLYEYAVRQKYRFFSFGDAMLIL